jgi:hypothetical protein
MSLSEASCSLSSRPASWSSKRSETLNAFFAVEKERLHATMKATRRTAWTATCNALDCCCRIQRRQGRQRAGRSHQGADDDEILPSEMLGVRDAARAAGGDIGVPDPSSEGDGNERERAV